MEQSNRANSATSVVVLALASLVFATGPSYAQTEARDDRSASKTKASDEQTESRALRASPAAPRPVPFSDRLTGDWNGERTGLADRGVTIDFETTHYCYGLFSGTGEESEKFNYGGRADLYVNFDTAKLGLWKGGAIRTHTEYAFGGLRANLGGAVLPMVLGVKLPNPGDRKHVDVTSIYLAQRISERVNLMIGKINPLDLLANDPFWGGAGHARFFSVGLGSPPNGLQTPVIMGTILSVHTQPIDWTMMVFDPSDRTRDYWPGDLFDRGVSFSLGGTHRRTIAGRTSSLTLTGIYTTADSVNLGEILLPPELQTGPREDAYHVGLQFSHFLKEDPMTRGQGWGFFLKMGGSDGRSNPFQSFISGGFGGSRLFGSRPRDSFGIGYFYVNFSDQLQNALNPLARFNDEQGVEAFYNIHIKQWLQLSGDLYFVNPAPAANKNALAGGLRLKFRL